MSASTLCFALVALFACSQAAPSGWPVVTYAQSYSAHAVDHSVAQSVYPAVAAARVLPAVAEPLIAAPQPLIAAPQRLVAAPQPFVAAPQPLLAAAAPYYASAAPYIPSPYVAW